MRFAPAVLLLLTLASYSNSFSTGFPLDNRQAILSDTRIREATGQNLDLIWNHTYWWPYDESGLYRPLTTLSFLFNYAILDNQDRPAGYHSINFLLHFANVLLVYALSLRLLADWRRALAIAGLWAVHPVLTEAVTNIVGRADLLAGLGVLGGWMAYLKARDSQGWRRVLWLATLAAASAVGAFSKESAAILPAVLVLYELALGRHFASRRTLAAIAAALVPIAAMLYQRSAVLASSLPTYNPFTDNPIAGTGFWTGRLTAFQVIARYLRLLVWPAHLSADYSYAEIPLARGNASEWLIAGAIIGATIAGLIVLWRRQRTAFLFAGFAVLTFLPASNLLFPTGTIMAERLLYLPAVGFAACLVLAIYAVSQRIPAAAPVVLCLIAAAFSLRTWARNPAWFVDASMADTLVRTVPRSFKGHRLRAWQLFTQDDSSHSNIDRAIAEMEIALAILRPLPPANDSAETWHMAGDIYSVKKDYAKAVEALLRSAAIMSAYQQRAASQGAAAAAYAGSGDLYRLLSADYLGLLDTAKAIEAADKALTTEPGNPDSYRALAGAYLDAGRKDDAAVVLMEGHITTQDIGLRDQVLQLYRSGLDPAGCAIVAGPSGPALNPSCVTVHRHLCAALSALKSPAARDYGCL